MKTTGTIHISALKYKKARIMRALSVQKIREKNVSPGELAFGVVHLRVPDERQWS